MSEICKLPEWDVVSISNDGEAVMASVLGEDLVIAKARSFTKVADMKKVRSAYIDALKRETDVGSLSVDDSITVDGQNWSTHFIQIDQGDVECILYADTCTVEDINVLEIQFSSLEQYLGFKPKLAELVAAINFHALRREYGRIEYLGVEVNAIAVSNLVYGGSNSENVMFFTGKNRYITVSVSSESHGSAMQRELEKNRLESVTSRMVDGILYTKYYVHNKAGKVTGILEFGAIEKDGVSIEVFGYSKSELDTFIVNDINLTIGGVVSSAKTE